MHSINGKKLRDIALKYINRHNTMTLATCNENIPWAATVFYANNEFTLYFISNPKVCLHCRNIHRNPRVAVTIDEDYPLKDLEDWRRIKGIQMEGIAEMLIDEEELNLAVKAYVEKYPFTAMYVKGMVSSPQLLAFLERILRKLRITPTFMASTENRFYKITPTRVWLVDNEVSFEKRLEVDLR